MSLIALPAGFCPNSFSMRLQTNQRAFASPFGGSEQVIDMGNDRWLVSLSLPNRKFADAARVEAFIASLRGMTNTVALFHWIRKVPRGTMRGSPVVAVGAPLFVGDPNIQVTTTAGATLLAGDMVGVGGQLFQVAKDVVANGSGAMNIDVVNRSRVAAASGSQVVWDKPTALFRQSSQSAVQYIPGYATEVSIDFVEAVS
ncbi:hypothetical protein [Variovorax paradoxus]|uniref:Uncharacterized protein n=1 Tax=Variovorax paradoxus TaxID=34073 RepID=A0A679JN57_VARPD|nr:hypothetical protein VVAX_04325 [Variovorax paradoxus]